MGGQGSGSMRKVAVAERHALIAASVAQDYSDGASSTEVMKRFKISIRPRVMKGRSCTWGAKIGDKLRGVKKSSEHVRKMRGLNSSSERVAALVKRNKERVWSEEDCLAAAQRARGNKNKIGRRLNKVAAKNVRIALKENLKKRVYGEHSQLTKRKMQKRKCQYLMRVGAATGKLDTDIEQVVEKQLVAEGMKYAHPYNLKNLRVAEFYLPDLKLIIECDGEWWHLLPGKAERDAAEDELVRAIGKEILRLPGKLIMRSDFNVRDEIVKKLVVPYCFGNIFSEVMV